MGHPYRGSSLPALKRSTVLGHVLDVVGSFWRNVLWTSLAVMGLVDPRCPLAIHGHLVQPQPLIPPEPVDLSE